MKKVIFICTGNTCRSPMAEGYLKSFALPRLTVLSRGLCADGSLVSENSVKVMNEAGIDIGGHISQSLSKDDLDADLFICMTATHGQYLAALGIDRKKIKAFPFEIPDPYGKGADDYRHCRDMMFLGIDEIVFGGGILPFSVKIADKNDIPEIAKLEVLTSSEPWSEKGIAESMEAATLFFKAESDGKFIGYIGLSVAADEGYITNVAVAEEYRKKGVATLLLNRVISEARKRRLSFVSLEVRVSNENAKNVYERLGFKVEGIRKGFYRSPTEDAIIMTRRF